MFEVALDQARDVLTKWFLFSFWSSWLCDRFQGKLSDALFLAAGIEVDVRPSPPVRLSPPLPLPMRRAVAT